MPDEATEIEALAFDAFKDDLGALFEMVTVRKAYIAGLRRGIESNREDLDEANEVLEAHATALPTLVAELQRLREQLAEMHPEYRRRSFSGANFHLDATFDQPPFTEELLEFIEVRHYTEWSTYTA